jgi:hypothetical protein
MILYLLVEGGNDRQFIEKVIAPCLPTPVHILAYAEWTATRRENQIRSLLSGCEKGMMDYYALMDMDSRPCYTACREYLSHLFGRLLPFERIIVAVRHSIDNHNFLMLNAKRLSSISTSSLAMR